MNPRVKYQILCSKDSLRGKIIGGLSPDIEISLLGMANRIIQATKDMKSLRLDRFTITVVVPKKSPAKKKS